MEPVASPSSVPPRRRRRAVGPPGARVADGVDRSLRDEQESAGPAGADDEARLRADVPPHHGS